MKEYKIKGAVQILAFALLLMTVSSPLTNSSPSQQLPVTQLSQSSSAAERPRILASDADLTTLLTQIFDRTQAARNLSDPERLRQAAEIVTDPETARDLKHVFEQAPERFNAARQSALSRVPIRLNGKSFVVSGLSASGAAAALIAAHAGYSVTGFETRQNYTRNIQWTGRQCIIDTLALIDQGLADRFLTQLVRPIVQEVDLVDHKISEVVPLSRPRRGDPTKIPETPGEMLNGNTVMLMQTKAVEKFMMDALRKTPNINLRIGQSVTPVRSGDGFELSGLGKPDLFVVAEGSGSKSRRAMGVEHVPTSPVRLEIAGELRAELGGNLAFNEEHVTNVDGSRDVLLTSAISNAGSGSSWSVTDVPKDLNLEPAGLTPGSEGYQKAKQDLVSEYYTQAVARVLRKPEAEVRSMVMSGPIEGMPPTAFQLQQNMSKTAVYGDNAVGIGDAVGNAHWNVGGGVHIAIVSHIRRLANLLFDLEIGRDRSAAMNEYNKHVLTDTIEWGKRGISDFYPNQNREKLQKLYEHSVHEWLSQPNATRSPGAQIDALISNGQGGTRSGDAHKVELVNSCQKIFAK